MHLGQRDNEGESVVLHVELEQVPAPDDLQGGKDDTPYINMGNKDVAGYFANMLKGLWG